MTTASATGALRRSVQWVHFHLSELVRVCATYLGIAVLVTGGAILAMPGLRDQAMQMHAALLAALAPDSVPADLNNATARAPSAADLAATAAAHAAAAARSDDRAGASSAVAAALPGVRNFQNAFGAEPPADAIYASGASDSQLEALRSYISRKYRVAYDATAILVNTAYRVGHDLDLDPLLLLAVIAIESRYNPFAESHVGAQGLMQVMTRVHKEKFEQFGGGEGVALNPVANIRVGSQILRDCIDRRGSLTGGLACYVGATGPSDGGYGAKVLAERRRLALAAGIRLAQG